MNKKTTETIKVINKTPTKGSWTPKAGKLTHGLLPLLVEKNLPASRKIIEEARGVLSLCINPKKNDAD